MPKKAQHCLLEVKQKSMALLTRCPSNGSDSDKGFLLLSLPKKETSPKAEGWAGRSEANFLCVHSVLCLGATYLPGR